MNQCPACDKTFSSTYNMNRHYDSAHPNNDIDKEEEDEEEEEEEEEEEDEEEVEAKDKEVETEEDNNSIWVGFRSNAGKGSLDTVRGQVVRSYIDAVEYCNKLRHDTTHKQITATKRKFLDDADEDEQLDEYEALRLAVAKRRYLIQQASGLESDDEVDEQEDEDSDEEIA